MSEPAWISLILSLILSVIAIVGFIWRGGVQWATIQSEIKALKDLTKKMSVKLEELEPLVKDSHLKIEPFWQLISQNLPLLLNISKSENLLEKVRDGTITDEELAHLEREVRALHPEVNGDRLVRILALWQIDVKKKERGLE